MLSTFDLQAHRGGRMMRPENTLAAFRYALEIGITTLELDVHVTADEQVIVSHNPMLSWYLARDEQGQWVREGEEPLLYTMNLDEVRRYNVGAVNPACRTYWQQFGQHQVSSEETIPTLHEVFALAEDYGATTLQFNIETKCYPTHPEWSPPPDRFCQLVLEVIACYGLENRVLFQSFDWRTLTAMKERNSSITRVALTESECRQPNAAGQYPWLGGVDLAECGFSIARAAQAVGAHILSPYYEDVTTDLLVETANLGMPIIPWTVNDQARMHQLVEMGVAGIITDHPELLRRVLREKGIIVPSALGSKKKFPEYTI